METEYPLDKAGGGVKFAAIAAAVAYRV